MRAATTSTWHSSLGPRLSLARVVASCTKGQAHREPRPRWPEGHLQQRSVSISCGRRPSSKRTVSRSSSSAARRYRRRTGAMVAARRGRWTPRPRHCRVEPRSTSPGSEARLRPKRGSQSKSTSRRWTRRPGRCRAARECTCSRSARCSWRMIGYSSARWALTVARRSSRVCSSRSTRMAMGA